MSSVVPSKTLAHELVNTNLTNSYSTQVSAVQENKPFTTFKEQFELYTEYINCKQKTDPIISEMTFWKNNLSKIESLPAEFIIFWLDKYENCHPKVKEELKIEINTEDTILQKFSDSITNVFRQDENINAKYTIVEDIEFDSTIPSPFSPVLQDKLNINTQNNVLNGSTKVNSLFNRSMRNISSGGQQNESHGSNLSTDYFHIQRLVENKPELLEIAADFVGSIYEVLLYINNYKLNNIQKVFPATFNFNVEGENVNVDSLGNKVQKDKPYGTLDMLG